MSDTLRIAIRKFESFETAIQRHWDAFKETTGTPVSLDAQALDLNPLVDLLFTREGLKNGEVDIAFIVTDWIADAVDSGALLDLTPLMESRPVPGYPHEWVPALTRFQQFGDSVYGLPYHDGPECLVYRSDLFENPDEQQAFESTVGRPLQPPANWADFEQVARFFTRPDAGQYGTLFAGFPDGHNTVYDFCIQLWSRGGELHDTDGRPTLNTAPAIEGLEFYRRMMADRTVTPANLDAIDSVQSGEIFAAGSIAMMVNWFGFAAVCEQPGSPTRGKVAVAPVPSIDGRTGASLNVYWMLAIGSGSRNPDLAYDFLRHCATDAMDRVTTLSGGIGCRLSTLNDPEVNARIPFYSQLPALHATARELPRSRHFPALSHIIDSAVQEALNSGEPVPSILDRAQKAASAIRL